MAESRLSVQEARNPLPGAGVVPIGESVCYTERNMRQLIETEYAVPYLNRVKRATKVSGSSVLTINAGSSSFRFALFEVGAGLSPLIRGKVDRIGLRGTNLTASVPGEVPLPAHHFAARDHHTAARRMLEWIRTQPAASSIAAVGHRIVHGMGRTAPQAVTARLVNELRAAIPFAPVHLPIEIELIEACWHLLPGAPQVACFDTAFHRGMPSVAKRLPIPRRFASGGVERYGFHGLSYEFLMGELNRLGDPAAVKGRVVLAHLGNGASLAAVLNGKSMDTSMGFTPAAGLVMSTRTGDIDPGVLSFLVRKRRLTEARLERMVNLESGLLGISGFSSDMRDLLARESRHVPSAEAVELFCYQARKWIGSFAAVLGGLDTLVFSGGIGENSSAVRERICAGLGFLGVRIDRRRNLQDAPVISRAADGVRVRVIRTDEEAVIARSAARVLRLRQKTS
jgi:acetate kinase